VLGVQSARVQPGPTRAQGIAARDPWAPEGSMAIALDDRGALVEDWASTPEAPAIGQSAAVSAPAVSAARSRRGCHRLRLLGLLAVRLCSGRIRISSSQRSLGLGCGCHRTAVGPLPSFVTVTLYPCRDIAIGTDDLPGPNLDQRRVVARVAGHYGQLTSRPTAGELRGAARIWFTGMDCCRLSTSLIPRKAITLPFRLAGQPRPPRWVARRCLLAESTHKRSII
jgi:hypothetical protein